MNRWLVTMAWGLSSIAISGCNGASLAKYDSDQIAAAAMAKLDVNKDGKIDITEAKKCPAISVSFVEIDANNDKGIDLAELTARFERYKTSPVTGRGVTVRVTKGLVPVEGITVTLEPESFMGGLVKPGTGVTNQQGFAEIKPADGAPTMSFGMYRAIVSKQENGKEKLPARFNTDSIFGWDVSPSGRMNALVDLGN